MLSTVVEHIPTSCYSRFRSFRSKRFGVKIVCVLSCYRLYGQQEIFSIGHLIWERTKTSLEDVPGYTSVGLDIRECVWTRPRSRLTICSTDVGLRLRLTSVGKDKGEKAYRGPGYFKHYVKKYRLRLSER